MMESSFAFTWIALFPIQIKSNRCYFVRMFCDTHFSFASIITWLQHLFEPISTTSIHLMYCIHSREEKKVYVFVAHLIVLYVIFRCLHCFQFFYACNSIFFSHYFLLCHSVNERFYELFKLLSKLLLKMNSITHSLLMPSFFIAVSVFSRLCMCTSIFIER